MFPIPSLGSRPSFAMETAERHSSAAFINFETCGPSRQVKWDSPSKCNHLKPELNPDNKE